MPKVNMDQLLSEGRSGQVIEGTARDITPRLISKRQVPEIEDDTYHIPPGPLRQLNLDRLDTKAQVMEQLNSFLPVNKFGLPDFIYRADLVDHGMMLTSLRRIREDPNANRNIAVEVQDMLNAATAYLDYSEGYPSLDGIPLWNRLAYEPQDAYIAFQGYMSLDGVRQASELISFPSNDVKTWFHLFLWNVRTKAFDMYRIVHHQRVRINRALSTEDNHYKMSDRLIKTILTRIEDKGKDWLDLIEPHQAINMLEKLVKIQRLSVGLSAMSAQEETQRAPSTPALMELVAGPHEEKAADAATTSEAILENPDAMAAAEDLILELNGRK